MHKMMFGLTLSGFLATVPLGKAHDVQMRSGTGEEEVLRKETSEPQRIHTGEVVGTHRVPWGGPWWMYEDYKLVASDGSPVAEFGNSVSLSGDVAIIGAHRDFENGIYAGAAYVYRYDPDTATWNEEQKLLASDGDFDDHFGCSVSLSGDFALIGAYGNDNESGAVYFFRYDDGTGAWSEEQKLTNPDYYFSGNFGYTVSMSGDAVVIGAPGNYPSGSAYVFRYDPVTELWNEEETLQPFGLYTYLYGYSVSYSGDVAVIGFPTDWDNGTYSGSAYVFRYDPVTESWTEEEKILASDGTENDAFGWSVSNDGDLAVIGASYDGDNGDDSGSAYVFRYDPAGETWEEEAKLSASDGSAFDYFAYGVSVSGDIAVIGAPFDDDNGIGSGSAYVFRYESDLETWKEEKKLLASDGDGSDHLGYSVTISGGVALSGAIGIDNQSGSAYIHILGSE